MQEEKKGFPPLPSKDVPQPGHKENTEVQKEQEQIREAPRKEEPAAKPEVPAEPQPAPEIKPPQQPGH
ncbi:MAG: hypothetical protein QM743_03845 [Chitinophagaceae bacterium]